MSIIVTYKGISCGSANEAQKELIKALGFLLSNGTYSWEQFYEEIEAYSLNEKAKALIELAKK